MDENEFAKILRAGEGQTIEFKPDLSPASTDSALESTCAFLNSGGGRTVVGVSDDGQPTGVRIGVKDRDRLNDKLSSLDPRGQPCRLEQFEYRGKTFLMVTAEQSPSGHLVEWRGVAYRRIGSQDIPISAREKADYYRAKHSEIAPGVYGPMWCPDCRAVVGMTVQAVIGGTKEDRIPKCPQCGKPMRSYTG